MHHLKCIDLFSFFQNVSDIRDKPLLLSSSSDSGSSDDDLEAAIWRQNRERYQIEEAIEEIESQENSKNKLGLRKINSSNDILSPAKTSQGGFNPLSANPTKWLNTLKQFVVHWPTNCLSVFDHFVGSALKGLTKQYTKRGVSSQEVPLTKSDQQCKSKMKIKLSTQPTSPYSKLTIEILEKGVKYIQS